MRDPDLFAGLRSRLLQEGCPPGRVSRAVVELCEHWDDLEQEALDHGMHRTEAATAATQRLGSIESLSEHYLRVIRRTSWCGRHRVLTFCVLPPVAFVGWFLVWLWLASWIDALLGSPAAGRPGRAANLLLIQAAAYGIYYSAVLILPLVLCHLAWACVHDAKWAWIGCACCSLHAAFHVLQVTPHSLIWSYGFKPDAVGVVVPWLACCLFLLRIRGGKPDPARPRTSTDHELLA